MPLTSRIWELARFHPDFIWVMFLIMMYERFVAQFGGKYFCPSISVSHIFPQLLTIMWDTRAFPFFSRADILEMLTSHGTTLHLVRALCGPLPIDNWRIMRLILRRVLSRIEFKPIVGSCFEMCSRAILTYSLCVPQSPFCVEISDENVVFDIQGNIWMIFSLITTLPDAKAILDISSDDLSDVQMRTYVKLYMIIVFRHLFQRRNKVLLLVCKYYHLNNLYEDQNRTPIFFRMLEKEIKHKLELLLNSHDYKVYFYYLCNLNAILRKTWVGKMNLLIASCYVLKRFVHEMSMFHFDDHERKSEISDFVGFSLLLEQEDQKKLLEMLKVDPRPPNRGTLSFCVSPPKQSSHEWLFPVLQTANRLILPPKLMECLKEYGSAILDPWSSGRGTPARILEVVFGFAKWLQSYHPHQNIIFEYVSFTKQTGAAKNANLARILDLLNFTSDCWREFHALFEKFRKYSHPIMECFDPTERTLHRFFKIIHMVFSNDSFLRITREFLNNEFLNTLPIPIECPPRNFNPVWFSFLDSLHSVWFSFLDSLSKDSKCSLIFKVCDFRDPYCFRCGVFLGFENKRSICDKGCDDDYSSS
jgi:hypothetical protein